MSELILGIDPGTRITGYGIIRLTSRGFEVVDYGCIRPTPSKTLPQRHRQIFDGVSHLLEKYPAAAMAVETQYVYKNVASSLKLGMARAVAMLAASLREIPVFEYAPTVAKRAVVGHGKASKEQVQKMVKALLSLSTIPEPEDAADALALAICHANTRRLSHV
jgi:crossover junction endodeoxyribonuclease RuvC